jgi:acyl-CoA reductase-like NAD-dependent aldehyde dehydrogenase
MQKVLRYIEQGSQQGARLSCGGQQVLRASGGFFVEPTIFEDVSEKMTIAREEIFGPVLSVMTFDSVVEGLHLANATDFGLSATLWTTNISVMHEAMRTLRVGELSINACARPSPGAMFGSLPLEPHKQSGVGGESGAHGLLAYTALTSVQIHSQRY